MQQGIDVHVEGKDCFMYGQVYYMAVQITSAACMKNFGVTKDGVTIQYSTQTPTMASKSLEVGIF
jgi:hypothetical protein